MNPSDYARFLERKPAKRRPNERETTGRTYCDDAATAQGPTILIEGCGSRWMGEEQGDFDELLEVLNVATLEPTFEEYGNFVEPCPVSAVTGERLLPDGWVMFWGNFFDLSHGFSVYTNDPQAIAELTAAIRANQGRESYAQAKATIAARKQQEKERQERQHKERLAKAAKEAHTAIARAQRAGITV